MQIDKLTIKNITAISALIILDCISYIIKSSFLLNLILYASILCLVRLSIRLSNLKNIKSQYQLIITISTLFWYLVPATINTWLTNSICRLRSEFPLCEDTTTQSLLFLYLHLFLLFNYIFSEYITGKNLDLTPKEQRVPKKKKAQIIFIIVFAIISFYEFKEIGIEKIFSQILLSRSENYQTSNLGNSESFFESIFNIVKHSATVFFIFYFSHSEKKLSKRNLIQILLIIVLGFLNVISSGNRSLLYLLLVPFLYFNQLKKKEVINLKNIAIGLGLLTFAVGLGSYRQQGAANFSIEKSASSILINTIDFYSESSVAISQFSTKVYDVRESNIYQLLTFPIPRFLFSDKPIPVAISEYTLLRWGKDIKYDTGNVMPGIMGQFFISGYMYFLFEFLVIQKLLFLVIHTLHSRTHDNLKKFIVSYTILSIFLQFRYFSISAVFQNLIFIITFYILARLVELRK